MEASRRAGLYAPLWGREKGRRKDGPGESTPFTFTEASQDPRPFTGIISFIARGSETETRAQDHNGPRWWSCRARARACLLDAAVSPGRSGGPAGADRAPGPRALEESAPRAQPCPETGERLRACKSAGSALPQGPGLPFGPGPGPGPCTRAPPAAPLTQRKPSRGGRAGGRGGARPAARGQQFRPPLPPARPAPGMRSGVGSRGPGRAALGSPERTRRERAAEPRRGMTALGVQVGESPVRGVWRGPAGVRGGKPPRARSPRGPAAPRLPNG